MTGKLSDLPIILAASIPHLGQMTPTAALVLRAIRSLLTRLDAGWPPTVLNTPTLVLSVAACFGPGLSGNTSFSPRETAIFPMYRGSHARGAPTSGPYNYGYDVTLPDISVTLDFGPACRAGRIILQCCGRLGKYRRDCLVLTTFCPGISRQICENRPEYVKMTKQPAVV
jgi:hypothetical protein